MRDVAEKFARLIAAGDWKNADLVVTSAYHSAPAGPYVAVDILLHVIALALEEAEADAR